MGLEQQLRELLDVLDLTSAMKSSGSRSKRAKLLKKEIAVLRSKLSQQHSQPPAAESGTAGPEEDGAPRGQEAAEEGKRSEALRAEAGVSSCLRRMWPLKNVGGEMRSVSQARFRLSTALQGGRRVRGWYAGAETWSGVSQQVPGDLVRLRRGGLSQLFSQGVHGGRALQRPCAPVGGTRAMRAPPPGTASGSAWAPGGALRVGGGSLPSSPHLRVGRFRQQHRLWGQVPCCAALGSCVWSF